ncbi:MAG TPA: dephospho-CoA kinase [Candidatus Acidoferrum sp.]|nr:dephospho-CoA kinase [Candidatus Acidoferrum sp.]
MLRLGLTGGIASGKSAVAEMLRELGFPVLQADELGHQVIEPGRPAYEEVVREFGRGILDGAGRVDRGKLGAMVFADGEKLKRLNAIVHPRVEEEMVRKFEEWEKAGEKNAAFVEAALLVEAGYQKRLDGMVVAWCRPEQQLERLKARGLSEEEARRRIAAQMPVEEKLKYATEKIDCSETLAETKRQVEKLAEKLRRGAAESV